MYKEEITKTYWFFKNFIFQKIEDMGISDKGLSKAIYKSTKKVQEYKEQIIKKQQSLPLSFFYDLNNNNLYSSLSYLLFPCNVGLHFNNGTPSIQKFIHLGDHQLNLSENYNLIRNRIIELNYYIDKHKLYFLRIKDIENIKIEKTKFYVHQEFLDNLNILYTKIFPNLQKIEHIISLSSFNVDYISEESKEMLFNANQEISKSLNLMHNKLFSTGN